MAEGKVGAIFWIDETMLAGAAWFLMAYPFHMECFDVIVVELFTLLHLFLPDSYWTPGILLDWTRTGTNFMLADHHTNFVSQS